MSAVEERFGPYGGRYVPETLIPALDELEQGWREALADDSFSPQVGEPTYAEKIGPADRELDWSRPAKELHDRIRALSPHIGARGEVEGRSVVVWRSRVDGDRLELLEVQPEGGTRMAYDAWLRGLRS